VLTLFVVPLLYMLFMRRTAERMAAGLIPSTAA
jgi:hypothetical protein